MILADDKNLYVNKVELDWAVYICIPIGKFVTAIALRNI